MPPANEQNRAHRNAHFVGTRRTHSLQTEKKLSGGQKTTRRRRPRTSFTPTRCGLVADEPTARASTSTPFRQSFELLRKRPVSGGLAYSFIRHPRQTGILDVAASDSSKMDFGLHRTKTRTSTKPPCSAKCCTAATFSTRSRSHMTTIARKMKREETRPRRPNSSPTRRRRRSVYLLIRERERCGPPPAACERPASSLTPGKFTEVPGLTKAISSAKPPCSPATHRNAQRRRHHRHASPTGLDAQNVSAKSSGAKTLEEKSRSSVSRIAVYSCDKPHRISEKRSQSHLD